MNIIANMSRITRSPGDPEIQSTGPSSLGTSDRLARALGWFSLGLGTAEIVAPERIARSLGMEGKERLIRAYGAREIASGIPTLSVDKHVGLISRVAGDAVDIATLLPAVRSDNPKHRNARMALAAVGAVTLLDIVATAAVLRRHSRSQGQRRDYSDRSGLPHGTEASRGLGRQKVEMQRDVRAAPSAAASIPSI